MEIKNYNLALISFIAGLAIATVGWKFLATETKETESPTLPSMAEETTTKTIGTAELDIDGDNTKEQVSLITKPNSDPDSFESKLILKINSEEIEVSGHNPIGYFGIVDLNVFDGQHEIALSDLGPSGDPTTNFYAFTGNQIKLLGTTEGLYEQMQFNGDGNFVTTTRAQILDTWFYRDTFKLAENNELVRVPKDFYERLSPQEPITVLAPITLQKSPTDSTKSVTLKKDDVVTIAGCDDIAWCKIITKEGTISWFELENFNIIKDTEQPATDFFAGLSNAD